MCKFQVLATYSLRLQLYMQQRHTVRESKLLPSVTPSLVVPDVHGVVHICMISGWNTFKKYFRFTIKYVFTQEDISQISR